MRKAILIVLLAVTSILELGNVQAQQASEKAIRVCREVTDNYAKKIFDARQRNLEFTVKRTSENWIEQVGNNMIQTAKEFPNLTQQEIATAGFTYCIARRPVGL